MQGLNPAAVAGAEPEEPTPVDIACFFPAANQAAGLAELLSEMTKTQCSGFVERTGTVAVGETRRRVTIVETALPHQQLALVVRDVITLRKPSWVLASGFATAVDLSVARGQLLVANRLVDAGGYSLSIDAKMSPTKGLHVGTLLTVDPAAASENPPVAAAAQDSQAAVIGEVCRVLKTKMMAVHCISAMPGQPGNIVAKKIKSQDSIAGVVGAAAGALIDQPSSIKGLWNDSAANLVFSDRLAKFVVGIISQLPT